MKKKQYCYFCGGKLDKKKITKIVTWKGKLIGLVNNVPAWVCNQCGEKFFDGNILEKIDSIFKTKRKPLKVVKVPEYRLN